MCFFGESNFPQQRAISWENRQLRYIIQQLGDKSFSLEGRSGWQYKASTSTSGPYCLCGEITINFSHTDYYFYRDSPLGNPASPTMHYFHILPCILHIGDNKKKFTPFQSSRESMHNFREDSHLYEHMNWELIVYLGHGAVCWSCNFLHGMYRRVLVA